MTTSNSSWKHPSLQDPLQYIKGVGPKRAVLLEKLDIDNVEDCLYFLPFRYEDRSRVKKVDQLVAAEQVTCLLHVVDSGAFRIGRRRKIYEMVLKDETGTIRAKWFHFNEKYLQGRYPAGTRILLSGKPSGPPRGASLEFIHPDIEPVAEAEIDPLEIGRIVPVYHSTEGLHLKSLRKIMKNVVENYAPLMVEILPDDMLRRLAFPGREEAFRFTHFPPNDADVKILDKFRTPAQMRLIFEELFLIQLGLAYKRKHSQETVRTAPFKTRGETIRKFIKLLHFELTGAQKKVLGEIMSDLEQERPMNRLLQGDVGSGKTIIALIALLTAVENGTQAALMVPTELLAEQHFLNIEPFCRRLGIAVELLTSAATAKEKKRIHRNIEQGSTQVLIGTHALIQKEIRFDKLGLAVIDEQHRFGVLQREAINKKGQNPHVLVMTATPIPRSLALTLYGEMDVSYLDEFPPGRQPIATSVFYEADRDKAYAALELELAQGRQAYVVCPLIEESETRDLKTATEVHDDIQNRLFPDKAIRLLHGRIDREERQRIMADFLAGNIDVLVATTVIEVGIDVANATVMIIEHAERFGLSQLHQLRGRVGRGQHASQCLLIAYHPLSDEGRARLQAIRTSNDGFVIAEEDLKIRGPGDFMGTRQSGMPLLKIADLLRDMKILELSRSEAFALIDRDPHLDDPLHLALRHTMFRFLGGRLDLLDIL